MPRSLFLGSSASSRRYLLFVQVSYISAITSYFWRSLSFALSASVTGLCFFAGDCSLAGSSAGLDFGCSAF